MHALHGQIFSFQTEYDNVLSSWLAYSGDNWDEIEVEVKNNFLRSLAYPQCSHLTQVRCGRDFA